MGPKLFFRLSQNTWIIWSLVRVTKPRPSSSFYPLRWQMRWDVRLLQREGERLRCGHRENKPDNVRSYTEECNTVSLNFSSNFLCNWRWWRQSTPRECKRSRDGRSQKDKTVIEKAGRTVFRWLSCKSCLSHGASPPSLCCAAERLHIFPQILWDSELKEHLPMKDFLPVFMSS